MKKLITEPLQCPAPGSLTSPAHRRNPSFSKKPRFSQRLWQQANPGQTGRAQAQTAGFTIMEVTVALGMVAVAMMLVAQLGHWSMRQRARSATRAAALELAANIMEQVQAQPWAEITPQWAAERQISPAMIRLLPGGKLSVTTEPVDSLPYTKRVIVDVRWEHPEGFESRPVRLVGLFSDRSARSRPP